MRLRELSVIRRSAARVWPYVVRPEFFQQWNAKIRSMDATGEFRVGQPFTTHYEWQGRPVQCTTVATEIQPGGVLELRHSGLVGPGIRPDMAVVERITLHEFGGTTRVTKTITIENHGAAWYWVVLIWLISHLGHRVGPDRLKEMCERDA